MSDVIQRQYIPELYRLNNLPHEAPKNPVPILESQVFNTLEEAKQWANQFYPTVMALDPAFRGCAVLRVIKDGANNGVYLVNPGDTSAVYYGGTGTSIDANNHINLNPGNGININSNNQVDVNVIAGQGIMVGASGEVQVKLSSDGNVDLSFDDNNAIKADVYYRHADNPGESTQDELVNDVGGLYSGTKFEDLIGPTGDKKVLNELLDRMLFSKRPRITYTDITDVGEHEFTAHSEYEVGTINISNKGWELSTEPNFASAIVVEDTSESFTYTFEDLNDYNTPSGTQNDIYYVRSYVDSEDGGKSYGEVKRVLMGDIDTGIYEGSDFDPEDPASITAAVSTILSLEHERWHYSAYEHRRYNPIYVAGNPYTGNMGRLFVLVPHSIGVGVHCLNQHGWKYADDEVFEVTYNNKVYTLYITRATSLYEYNNEFKIYAK